MSSKIPNTDFEEFYNSNVDYIENAFFKYGFCCDNKSDFYKLCKNFVLEIYKTNNHKNLQIELTKKIKEYIKNVIKNNYENQALPLIVKSAKERLTYVDDYNKNFYNLKSFSLFFLKLGIEFDIELAISILNDTPILNQILSDVVEKEISNIRQYDITELYNENLAVLIEGYCSKKHIVITNDNLDTLYEEFIKDRSQDSTALFLKEIGKYSLLQPETQRELLIQYIQHQDQKAKEKLINHNLRLVVNIAKKYQNRGLDFLDLIQEGTLGLIKAIDRFDLNKQTELSTYATWWIRQAIIRAIGDKGRNIRLPIHLIEKVTKINRFKADFEKQNNREATLEEIAEEFNMTVSKLNELIIKAKDVTSLNQTVDEDDETELGHFVEDVRSKFEDEVVNENFKKHILKILNETLTERELEIILMRFGFYDDEPLTLEECGKKFNITRERVRQIEAKALRKLRHPNSINKLNGISLNKGEFEIQKSNSQEEKQKTSSHITNSPIEKMDYASVAILLSYFPEHNYDNLNAVLEKLSQQEIKILKIKAQDIIKGTATLSTISETEIKTTLFPKIKSMLQHEAKINPPKISLEDYDLKQLNLYFSEYSYNQVKIACSILNSTEIYTLKKLLKSNIKEGTNSLGLDAQISIQQTIFSKITSALDAIYPSTKKSKPRYLFPKSFYEKFNGHSIQEIHAAVSNLSKTDYKNLITACFSQNTSAQEIAKDRVYRVTIPSILQYLNPKENEPSKSQRRIRKMGIKDIYGLFNKFSKGQINQALLCLDIEDFKLLKKKISSDYALATFKELTSEEQKRINQIILPSISQMLKAKKPKGPSLSKRFVESFNCCKNIYTFFSEYSKKEINAVLKTLDFNEYNILIKRFGYNFSNPTLSILNKEDTNYFYSKIIPKISRRLKEEFSKISTDKKRYFSFTNLYKNFEPFSKDEINNAIKQLDEEEYKILEKWFGESFENPVYSPLTEEEIEKLHGSILLKIMTLLKNNSQINIEEQKRKKLFNIYVYFHNYTKEEINCALRCLSDEQYKVLLKKLDNSFTNHTLNNLSKEESYKLFANGISKLEKALTLPKNNFIDLDLSNDQTFNGDIYSYFSIYKKSQIKNAITLLSEEEQELLKMNVYETNDFDKINYLINILLPKLKGLLDKDNANRNKKQTSNKYNFYLNFPNNSKEEIDEAISKLDENYQRILYRRYSYDLENPIFTSLSKEENQILSSIIIPAIKNSFKKEKKKMEKKEKRSTKKAATIYSYFKEFTKEEIDAAISELKPEHYTLLFGRYGGFLEDPLPSNLSKNEYTKFYQTVLPNLKKILSKNSNLKPENNDIITNDTKPEITSEKPINPESNNTTEIIETRNKEMQKNSYITSINELKNAVLEEMISQLPVEKAFILNLKFGYIRDKYFSNKEIAMFLGISEDEIRTTIKTTLTAYKELLVAKMDESIDIITNDSYQYVKKQNEQPN